MGVATTTPGGREYLFYHPPTTDPLVLNHDEATKSVYAFTELPGAIVGFIGPLTLSFGGTFF